jgi:hypothetical protein
VTAGPRQAVQTDLIFFGVTPLITGGGIDGDVASHCTLSGPGALPSISWNS